MKESPAIREWQEKLDLLQVEEARATDAAAKFKLGKEIAEATARLKELLAEDSHIGEARGRKVDISRIDKYAPEEVVGRQVESKVPLSGAPSAPAAELAAENAKVEVSRINKPWRPTALGHRWPVAVVAVAAVIVFLWWLWRPSENPPPVPRPPRPSVTILGPGPTDSGNALVGRRTGIDKDDPHTVIAVWTCKPVCRPTGKTSVNSLGEWDMIVPSGEAYVAAAVAIGYRGEDAQDIDLLRRRLGAQYSYDAWPRLNSPKSSGSGWILPAVLGSVLAVAAAGAYVVLRRRKGSGSSLPAAKAPGSNEPGRMD